VHLDDLVFFILLLRLFLHWAQILLEDTSVEERNSNINIRWFNGL